MRPPHSTLPAQEVLRDLRLGDSRYVKSSLAEPWGMRIVGCGRSVFHFAARGAAVVRVGDEVGTLQQGDLVLVPHGQTHELLDSASSSVHVLSELARETFSPLGVQLSNGGDGERSLLISGSFVFDPHPVVAELPNALYVRKRPGADDNTQRLIAVLLDEVQQPGPGSEAVVDRLADVLVIRAIRSWLDTGSNADRGWVSALRDPRLGRALALIHTEATRSWTLSALASEAGMSRASFASRFAEQVGTSPMRFLTDRRMQLASRWLAQDGLSVAEAADRLGYASAAAFSRAFKRTTGKTPGAVARST